LHLGEPGAEAALLRWLEANPSISAERRSSIWLLICEERIRRTRYAAALRACGEAEKAVSGSAGPLLDYFAPLARVPPMRWSVSGLEVPIVKDSDGTRRVMIQGPAGDIDAVIDTGAEITVLMDSVARQLDAKPVGQLTMGTTTAPVSGGLALVDRLWIGGAELLNVPALVLPDEQLTFPDGTSLPVVLSFAALTSAGRAAFLRNGTLLALGDAAPDMRGQPVPIYWDPSGVGFQALFAMGRRAVFLDTGSRRNYLYPTAERSLSEAELRTRAPFEREIAGIGGQRTEQAFRFSRVTIHVDGHPWTFAPMEMAPADGEGAAAKIGAAIMDRFGTVVLDFDRMLMFVGE
jgi:predicted aspartyl protease